MVSKPGNIRVNISKEKHDPNTCNDIFETEFIFLKYSYFKKIKFARLFVDFMFVLLIHQQPANFENFHARR